MTDEMSTHLASTSADVGGSRITVLQAGSGRPLVVLHDELGFPGWMYWNERLAESHELLIPLQPGFGVTPRIEWFRSYRDVAAVYSWMLRDFDLGPVDVIGFSAGGFIAACMAVTSPDLFRRMVLVAPLGVRPSDGDIYDFLAVTVRTHVAATVGRHDAPEYAQIYGGTISSEQFSLFEAARAETSRLGWEPFMFDPSLPHLLGAARVKTKIVWGDEDLIIPRSAMEIYQRSLPDADLVVLPGVGHRPEIEAPDEFLQIVSPFLAERQES